jgi:organic radical activating enzyme
MFYAFVFRITTLCNKKCPTCCCETSQKILSPDKFKEKLMQISNYFAKNPNGNLTIFLTGGEPFLYKTKSDNGETWNLATLIGLVRTLLPKSNIVIKTSGWSKNTVLDNLLSTIESQRKEENLEVRMGFNLFQNLGVKAEDRLHHMVSLLLKYQNLITIETIYDKINKDETFKIIGKTFSKFLENVENFGEQIVTPTAAYIIEFPFFLPPHTRNKNKIAQKKVIYLWTMPAHSGRIKIDSNQYYDSENAGVCANIQSGATQIMYNTDLSFHHCNDAFADYSNDAFPPNSFNSIEDEFLFLNEKFKKLKRYSAKHPQFKTKNEQCNFCTKFIHGTS